MKPAEALSKHRETVLAIAAGMGMRNVRVFGSVLHGDDREGGDIDLLVDAPDNATLLDMVALQRELESRLCIPVDVLTPDDLPARFKEAVLREARLL